MRNIKILIKWLFKLIGLEISYGRSSDIIRRIKLINYMEINKIFDIGANVGNYGIELRNYNYNGNIYSFEPIKFIYNKLNKKSSRDDKWYTYNFALGDFSCETEINVSEVSDTSSILELMPEQLSNAPSSLYVRKEKILVKTIDEIFDQYVSEGDRVMIKIDTQGYEKNVLMGALNNLKNICIIQLELSFVQLYENESLFFDMNTFLNEKGFVLYSVENGFANQKNGRLLQADGIYINESLIK